MAPHENPGTEASVATNEAYATHTEGRAAANEAKRKEAEEAAASSGLVSVEGTLTDEAKFVGNPDDLRKDVDSEEKFSERLEDGEQDLGLPDQGEPVVEEKPAVTKPATKKAAAKKS